MDTNFGTWNVRTLYQAGTLNNILAQLSKYQMELVAIQEIRWPGSGTLNKHKYTIYYSGGSNNRHEFGCGFIVNKRIQTKVIGFEPINDRICYLRIKMKIRNLSIFSVHAPTEEKTEEEKEAFYTKLDREIEKVPRGDVKLILGDLNAQIGKEEEYAEITGRHSLHTVTNSNGELLIQLAASHNLRIRSTAFPHKNIHKGTWTSPDGRTVNQIDHVLIDSRTYSSILDVRSLRGAVSESDHFLVKCKLRERIEEGKKKNVQKIPKINVDKLKDENILNMYKSKITELLQNRDNSESENGSDNENEIGNETHETVEQRWEEIKGTIKRVAEETLGTYREKTRNEWYDEECSKIVEKRNEARLQMIQRPTRNKKNEYDRLRREAKYTCRRKKRKMINDQLLEMQTAHDKNEIRNFYKIIKRTGTNYQPRETMCRDKDGKMLVNTDEVVDRWKNYFDEILNRKENERRRHGIEQELSNAAQPMIKTPSIDEIKDSISRMKKNKSPGIDNIPVETIQQGGEELISRIHKLIGDIWNTEKIPSEWETAILCPVHKKGERQRCENYRGISLLCTTYKIFTDILRTRITPYAEEQIGEYQAGFRSGKSTIDQLFTIRQILEKTWEYDVGVYQIFVDFKQAYDNIHRDALYNAMEEMGIPIKLVNLVKTTMNNSKAKVKIQHMLSETFDVEQGLRQGDGLAPLLFNIALHKVIRGMEVDGNGTIIIKETQIIAYADDINIVGRTKAAVKNRYEELKEKGKNMGLEVNITKTKAMVSKDERRAGQNWTMGDDNIEVVNDFTYLGSIINNRNDMNQEIRQRILKGNKALFALNNIFKSKLVHKETKITTYKTLIRPVVTYGCETWTLTNKMEGMLSVFERKVLRKIYGPVRENGEWRIRYNFELEQLYKELNIVDYVKIQRLRWAGHVERMDPQRVPKKVFSGIIAGRRKRGRPRTRWRDNIQKDANELLDVRNWQVTARDRSLWRQKLREVKVQ